MNKKSTAATTFESYGLSPEIHAGIRDAGFETPSAIQAEVIPLILEGRDVIAQSETGTGKTAAFGLPIMSRFLPAEGVVVLVIVPTRELALQVSAELVMLGKHAGARAAVVYGGASARDQIRKIDHGATIVTGTPGRILDLLSSGRIKLQPAVVVLDEADRMLDMGFLEDIEQIFKHLPKERQTLLFSATLPERIQKLAGGILNNPARVRTESTGTAPKITQSFCIVPENEREMALLRLFDFEQPGSAIVFCRTKRETDELTVRLIARGVQARAIHGDMDQSKREQVLGQFRAGKIRTLIATDVAARGLDVPGISHVFNYHIPFDSDGYVHRIGRTGRAGTEGRSITFVSPGEMNRFHRMTRQTGDSEFLRIPTLSELREKRQDELVKSVSSTAASPTSGRLLEKLAAGSDTQELLLRLVTLLEKQQHFEGPERIGKDQYQPQDRPHSASDRPFRTGGFKGGKGKFRARAERPRFSERGPRRDRDSRPHRDRDTAREGKKTHAAPTHRHAAPAAKPKGAPSRADAPHAGVKKKAFATTHKKKKKDHKKVKGH